MSSMEWLKGEYSKLISFVSEKKSEKWNEQKTVPCGQNQLDGNKAKQFYEELINDATSETPKHDHYFSSTSDDTLSTSRIPKSSNLQFVEERKANVTNIDLNRYLRYAQEGDLKNMKMMLDKGVPLNYQDEFGWTALMCASYGGHIEIAKYLLSIGVDKDIADRHGKNAINIANSNGYSKLANFIRKWSSIPTANNFHVDSTDEELHVFYCESCKCNFSDCSQKEHESSTVHLFNLKKKVKEDPFLLPSSNIGYKMMLRSGWDGTKGLGSEGQGHKYPVKTVLKRDRKCLGSEKSEKPKITHFNSNDKMSIVKNLERKLSNRGINKKQLKAKEKKRKQWERNLRTSMSLDL